MLFFDCVCFRIYFLFLFFWNCISFIDNIQYITFIFERKKKEKKQEIVYF